MTGNQFFEANNVRQCEKCCATCRHGRDLMDDGVYECVHPSLDGESVITDASQVCNVWEK